MEKIDTKKLGKTVAIISPHDDDGIIGCGGLVYELSLQGIKSYVIVMTDGSLGYSTVEQKNTISNIRKKEAVNAYKLLGANIIFLDFPDMCLNSYKCWKTPEGKEGAYLKLLKVLRKIKPETIFIPNHLDKHPDHQATYDIASVCCFQAPEPIAVDLGKPKSLKNVFCYKAVSKLGKRTHSFKLSEKSQKIKKDALSEFESQKKIIKSLNISYNYKKEKFNLLK